MPTPRIERHHQLVYPTLQHSTHTLSRCRWYTIDWLVAADPANYYIIFQREVVCCLRQKLFLNFQRFLYQIEYRNLLQHQKRHGTHHRWSTSPDGLFSISILIHSTCPRCWQQDAIKVQNIWSLLRVSNVTTFKPYYTIALLTKRTLACFYPPAEINNWSPYKLTRFCFVLTIWRARSSSGDFKMNTSVHYTGLESTIAETGCHLFSFFFFFFIPRIQPTLPVRTYTHTHAPSHPPPSRIYRVWWWWWWRFKKEMYFTVQNQIVQRLRACSTCPGNPTDPRLLSHPLSLT